MITEKGIK